MASSTFKHELRVVSDEMIADINENTSWTASREWVGDMTNEEAKAYTGTFIEKSDFPKKDFGALEDFVAVPDSFESREHWPGCVHPILNQAQCGSCWAFGASEALSDRYCVQKHIQVVLSPQYLVSCDTGDMGCNGGWLSVAWSFMQTHGISTMECTPYTSGAGKSGDCPSTCENGSKPTFYKATNLGAFDNPTSIQLEIMRGGPVETAFTVYQDFFAYTGGIYVHRSGSVAGGHAVKITGWGKSAEGTNYWIVANSWGTDWGIQGDFWIAFGQCGIDSDAYAGDAA